MKLACLAVVFLAGGCATVLKRDAEPIAVESTPAAADAVIQCAGNVRASGVTPTRLMIPRTVDGCALSISRDRFATKVVPLERGFNGAYWSNFALLPGITLALFLGSGENSSKHAATAAGAAGMSGLFGFLVDRGNGRGYRHFPDEINATLEPIK